MKSLKKYLYFIAVFFALQCGFLVKSFSQPIVQNVLNRAQLYTAYNQIIFDTDRDINIPCKVNEDLSIFEMIAATNRYEKAGNWQCCNAYISLLLKKQGIATAGEQTAIFVTRASILNSMQLYDSAAILALVAKAMANSQNDQLAEAQAYLILSTGALKKRNISSAYAWADSALQLARNVNNYKEEGRALLQLALCARRHFTSASQRAFPYYLQAIDAAKRVSDTLTLFTASLYYGDDLFEISKPEEGLAYFKNAIVLGAKSTDVFVKYKMYAGAGYIFEQSQLYDQATALYKRGLALSENINLPYSIEGFSYFLASVCIREKNYDSAMFYANKVAAVKNLDPHWVNIALLKAEILHGQKNFEAASEQHGLALQWANEDFLYMNADELNGYESTLKTKEKELTIVAEKKRSDSLQKIALAVIILLLLAAMAIILQRRAKRELDIRHKFIQKQKLQLQKSIAEKDVLLKEIHHRVKNNLTVISSLLDLQLSSVDSEKAKMSISEARQRIFAIALIHHRLYQHENFTQISIREFVEDMIREISLVFQKPSQKITTEIISSEIFLDIDTAIPLGLIINELLTNSFKYAFSLENEARLSIKIETTLKGNYLMTYADNGPGLPEGLNINKTNSLGLRLIARLSTQIGGESVYEYYNGGTFLISFKDSETKNIDA